MMRSLWSSARWSLFAAVLGAALLGPGWLSERGGVGEAGLEKGAVVVGEVAGGVGGMEDVSEVVERDLVERLGLRIQLLQGQLGPVRAVIGRWRCGGDGHPSGLRTRRDTESTEPHGGPWKMRSATRRA